MQKNSRWMKSMIAEAKKTEVELPWARGARRVGFQAARAAQALKAPKAARA
ncbi:MAG: hypothetical protein ACRBBK_10205 [Paracoccaceae bacterium]